MLSVLDGIIAALKRYHSFNDRSAEEAAHLSYAVGLREREAAFVLNVRNVRKSAVVKQLVSRDYRQFAFRHILCRTGISFDHYRVAVNGRRYHVPDRSVVPQPSRDGRVVEGEHVDFFPLHFNAPDILDLAYGISLCMYQA